MLIWRALNIMWFIKHSRKIFSETQIWIWRIQQSKELGKFFWYVDAWELFPRREFNSSYLLNLHFRNAQAQFCWYHKTRDVLRVTYVINHTLQSDFKETEKEFTKNGNNACEAKPILAFHDTPLSCYHKFNKK